MSESAQIISLLKRSLKTKGLTYRDLAKRVGLSEASIKRVFAEEIEEQTFKSAPVPADQDAHRLHWLDCIRTRKPAIGDVETAAKVMVIVDLATKSLWTKSAYTFDPSKLTSARG